ncbi:MAG: rRNA maturation RNase YbeY, partial [Alistipes sp.]|nr:rRNA maturation RNase YbeY [Candidatus Minthomonas equi]
MNREFLGHDFYTDIITFDTLDDQVIKKNTLSGDIFISIDTVRINSKTYSSSFEDELLRVMIHGVLHLMGYDDHTPEEEMEMHHQEDLALEIYYGKTI